MIDPHRGQRVLDYPWSSAAGGHALLPNPRPAWLASVRAVAAYGMKLAGLTEEDLARLPGSHPRKVAIARRVWQETTVTLRWISDHLHLCSAANASQQIRRQRQAPLELPKPLQKWLTQSRKVACA